jgi:hypothetical protein
VLEFARITVLGRDCTAALTRGFLSLFAFMAYGCACVPVGHFHGNSHLGSAITSSLHPIAVAFEHTECGNGGDRCHDDLPVGSTSDSRTIANALSQPAPAISHILPMIGWVSAEESGRERSPPTPSPAGHPEVRLTRATSLAVLCVFRS